VPGSTSAANNVNCPAVSNGAIAGELSTKAGPENVKPPSRVMLGISGAMSETHVASLNTVGDHSQPYRTGTEVRPAPTSSTSSVTYMTRMRSQAR